jgi:hypothetical protein
MEFVAPPVWFWLSPMNVELRRVGIRYILRNGKYSELVDGREDGVQRQYL